MAPETEMQSRPTRLLRLQQRKRNPRLLLGEQLDQLRTSHSPRVTLQELASAAGLSLDTMQALVNGARGTDRVTRRQLECAAKRLGATVTISWPDGDEMTKTELGTTIGELYAKGARITVQSQPPSALQTLGQRLKEIRHKRDFPLEEVAEAAGFTPRQLDDLEKGIICHGTITFHMMCELTRILSCAMNISVRGRIPNETPINQLLVNGARFTFIE